MRSYSSCEKNNSLSLAADFTSSSQSTSLARKSTIISILLVLNTFLHNVFEHLLVLSLFISSKIVFLEKQVSINV